MQELRKEFANNLIENGTVAIKGLLGFLRTEGTLSEISAVPQNLIDDCETLALHLEEYVDKLKAEYS